MAEQKKSDMNQALAKASLVAEQKKRDVNQSSAKANVKASFGDN